MPVYEYACTSCGERTEAKQSFTDPPLEECPVCGGRLRKLYSPVGIVFKGSGFYSTDARKGKASDGKTGDKKGSDAKKAGAGASTYGDKGGTGDGASKPSSKQERPA